MSVGTKTGHPKQTDFRLVHGGTLRGADGGDILVIPARLDWGIQPDGIASPLQKQNRVPAEVWPWGIRCRMYAPHVSTRQGAKGSKIGRLRSGMSSPPAIFPLSGPSENMSASWHTAHLVASCVLAERKHGDIFGKSGNK